MQHRGRTLRNNSIQPKRLHQEAQSIFEGEH